MVQWLKSDYLVWSLVPLFITRAFGDILPLVPSSFVSVNGG